MIRASTICHADNGVRGIKRNGAQAPTRAVIEATMADIADRTQDFGANSWLVEEMYERYRADQNSVSEAWREFFSDYRSATVAAAPVTTAVPASPLASSNGSAVAQPSAAATAAAPAPKKEDSEPKK